MANKDVVVVFSLKCCGILFAMAVVVGLVFAFGDKYIPQYQVDVIPERSLMGEGPFWDERHQRLYWVDSGNMTINSYTPDTGKLFQARVVSENKPISTVIPVKDTADMFVVAVKDYIALVQWDGVSNVEVEPVTVLDVIEDFTEGSRCNDARVDPSNRLWIGTIGALIDSSPNGTKFEEDKGELFKVVFESNYVKRTRLVDKMQIPNGLEWSLDKKRFYFVDSLKATVTEYEYDDKEGTVKKPKVIYDLKAHGYIEKPNSLPDGMTIDNEGALWIAVYGTGKIIRIDPITGEGLFEMQIKEVLQPTSLCFGGKDLDTLYVTSAHVDWTDQYEREYPQSGNLLKITNLRVKGAGPSRPVDVPHHFISNVMNTRGKITTCKVL